MTSKGIHPAWVNPSTNKRRTGPPLALENMQRISILGVTHRPTSLEKNLGAVARGRNQLVASEIAIEHTGSSQSARRIGRIDGEAGVHNHDGRHGRHGVAAGWTLMNFTLDDSHSHNIRREPRLISISPGTASNCFSNNITEHSGQSGPSWRHLDTELGQSDLLPQHLLGRRHDHVLEETVDRISCTMTTDWDWMRPDFMLNSMVMNNKTFNDNVNWPNLGSFTTNSWGELKTEQNTNWPNLG